MPSPEVMETGFQLTKARSCQKNLLSSTLAASIKHQVPSGEDKQSRWQEILHHFLRYSWPLGLPCALDFLSHLPEHHWSWVIKWLSPTHVCDKLLGPSFCLDICYMTWFFFLLCILKRKFSVVENLKLAHTAEKISLPTYQPSRYTVILCLTLLEFFVFF